ncbi:hypothetical protein EGW08_022572, partial [Elysia chlorotica]
SHQYMLKAGLIKKLASGIYIWLPMGLKVLHKIQEIVRKEMNSTGASELLLPSILPSELLKETHRWEKFGPELLKLKDRNDRDFCYGPTHEEPIVDMARDIIKSYKQLPLNLYQIQTKFRDEIRPRFGVMRSREFIMKDAYSFHENLDCLHHTYETMYQTYCNILDSIGLEYRPVKADTGSIGGDNSHEFQVLANAGEDVICYNVPNYTIADIRNIVSGDDSPDGNGTLELTNGIEVGHIFELEDVYSKPMNATIIGRDGKSMPLLMGCYGFGVSRVVAASIEQSHDDRGIVWPASIAPYDVAILPINYNKSEGVKELADSIYQDLKNNGLDVLLDDRGTRPGVMFADADLVGYTHHVIIGDRLLE